MPWYFNLPLAAAEVAVEAPKDFGAGTKLLMAVAVIVGSFAVGSMIARWLRMRDYSFKIGFILCTVVAGLVIDALGTPKLGIDLNGGTVLIYQVESGDLAKLVVELRKNLKADEELPLEVQDSGGKIEIPVPAGADVAKIKARVASVASSELQVDNVREKQAADHVVLVYEVQAQHDVDMGKLVSAIIQRLDPGGIKELTIRPYGPKMIEVIIPETLTREVELIKQKIKTAGILQFRIVANRRVNDHLKIIEVAKTIPDDNVYYGGKLVGHWSKVLKGAHIPDEAVRRGEGEQTQVLMIVDLYNINGDMLDRAAASTDEKGRPSVAFSFGAKGATLFGELTREHKPNEQTGVTHSLAILLDDTMQSAPTIQSEIRSSGQITFGESDPEKVDFLVTVLNAGHLPASLNPKPIREEVISEQLGKDTIESGKLSMTVSTVAVLVFMLVYYRFAGIVADLAVVLNMVLAVALMIAIKAAFTLPGLAGLVLTVGMAVDANVLIYERMREEQGRGASLRMTIRNGFARAWTTIIDSNLTTVITAVVLYIIGSSQVKGFAVSLIIGLLVSLYTAVFVARVIFDVFERQRWLTRLKMMQMIGATHLDFIRWLVPAVVFSSVVIAIGLIAAYQRGDDLFDIDFTGGTSVHFKLTEPVAIATVREKLEKTDLKDVSVSSVGKSGDEIKLDTSEPDIEKIKQELRENFDNLQRYSMDYTLARLEARPADKSTGSGGEANSKAKDAAGTGDEAPAAKENEGARSERRGRTLPGAAGGVAVRLASLALAQSDSQSEASASEANASDEASEPAATDTADEESASSDSTPGDSTPGDSEQSTDKSSDQKPESEQSADDATPAATEEKAETEAPTEQPKQPDASKPGSAETTGLVTVADMHFPKEQEINYTVLKDFIDTVLKAQKFGEVKYTLAADDPEYKAGMNNGFSKWKLQIGLSEEDARQVLDGVQVRLAREPVFPSASSIGAKVAVDTRLLAVWALLASLVMIVIYVWIRFQSVMFGFAAVLALVHDVLVTIGFLALSTWLTKIPLFDHYLLVDPFKISLAVVAALLTIVGYSINDTIVIFDRIREVRGKSPDLTEKMINDSVNQTLSRTILTSGTVLIGTIILYFIGGQGIHPFAYAMLVGLISGTYSTVYIASPMLLWLRKPAEKQPVERQVPRVGSPSPATTR